MPLLLAILGSVVRPTPQAPAIQGPLSKDEIRSLLRSL